jgi:ribonucleoside-diphosphate reductase alpha chain
MVGLTENAIKVLKKRYLLRDKKGKIKETPEQMFRRVAKAVAKADKRYGDNPANAEKEFFQIMSKLEFLPNSPTLMNAGTEIGQLAACFVLPIEDSLESIFAQVKNMAMISQSGGGTGFNFSKIRAKGDIVKSTKGVASGPVSFMKVFNSSTEIIKQGGKRRGANMAVLNVSHPDIEEFITIKNDAGELENFNLSVAVTDKFMNAVIKNEKFSLTDPYNGKEVKKINSKKLFDKITENAWKTGDPGLIFIDEINRKNALIKMGRIESMNPCGEQPLFPYESCNLGSINLSKMVTDRKIDYDKLEKTVNIAVHFLDNVIDINKYPLQEIEKITKSNRKIGLGVMGFADMLIKLNVPYGSKESEEISEKIMKFISETAKKKSQEIAKKRGSFPNLSKSNYKTRQRNATITTIAPTGSISIIAGCSSGIEPLFAISYVRNVMDKTQLMEANQMFENEAKQKGFYSKKLLEKIARKGTIQDIKEIPEDIRKKYVTTFDITPEQHLRIQAGFQKYTDNAVSKTINFATNATKHDVKKAYLLAYKLKLKGITVFRYGSKKGQVLYVGKITKKQLVRQETTVGCQTIYCPA